MTNIPLIENYLKMFRNYAHFSGRASRSELWWAMLMNYLVTFVIRIVFSFLSTLLSFGGQDSLKMNIGISGIITLASMLYNLIVLLPLTALQIRRLHDINRSGWWILLSYTGIGSIILLIWFCEPGTEDTNLFGSDPHPIRQY